MYVSCNVSPVPGLWEHPPPGGLAVRAGGAGAARSNPRPSVTLGEVASTAVIGHGQHCPQPLGAAFDTAWPLPGLLIRVRIPHLQVSCHPVPREVPDVWGWGSLPCSSCPTPGSGCGMNPALPPLRCLPAHGDPSSTLTTRSAALQVNISNGCASRSRDK